MIAPLQNFMALGAVSTLITLILFKIIIKLSRHVMHPILNLIYIIAIYIIVLYLPVYKGYTLIIMFRGTFSDLSVTSFVLLGIMLVQTILTPFKRVRLNLHFASIITILGTLLYISTFDILHFDIYDLGYLPDGWLLFGFIGLALLLSDYARSYAWLWLLALAAFYFKVQYSDNLWDYLFDPILWMVSIFSLFVRKTKIPV